ncbi:MAG: adenylate/guanylate cyclase domain-containing protein [Ginsengibacter sp.]
MSKWFQHIQFYTAGWFFASIFFYMMRQVGVAGVNGVNVPLKHFVLLLPVFSLAPGLIFGSLQYLFEKNLKVSIPLPIQLIRIFVIQLIVITIFALAFYLIISGGNFWAFLNSPATFVFNFYVLIANLFFAFLIEIIKLIGRRNFIKLITGKFYTPKEEYRIFMFIDLKSSTSIAEKLGHLSYSHFIKDCYADLDVVMKYGTEIYQYVGDEVVFTWERSKIKRVTQCVEAFWSFHNKLLSKADYYTSNYGVVPEFKAGMSIGMVTVVEIGDFKKEIAYHGNVLNTTSRVVDLCNFFGEKLLITKKVYDELMSEKPHYIFQKVTETKLRGKSELTEVFSITLHESKVLVP